MEALRLVLAGAGCGLLCCALLLVYGWIRVRCGDASGAGVLLLAALVTAAALVWTRT